MTTTNTESAVDTGVHRYGSDGLEASRKTENDGVY